MGSSTSGVDCGHVMVVGWPMWVAGGEECGERFGRRGWMVVVGVAGEGRGGWRMTHR